MKIDAKKIFEVRFDVQRETKIAIILGIASIIVSMLMNVFNTYAGKLILRDILQISLFGVIIPFLVLSGKGDFINAGLRFDKPLKYLIISILLGGFTAIGFIKQAPGGISGILRSENLFPALYVMTACTYELIFFYVFMRYYLEKAFGIIPAIILTALFYSMHHAGFEPLFLKLFIVGLVYMTVFRIANHWLIMIPAWWVGGLGDVLIQSVEVTKSIFGMNPLRILLILIPIIVMFIVKYPFKNNTNAAKQVIGK